MSESSDQEPDQSASDSKSHSIQHSVENDSNNCNSQSTLKRSLSSDDENDADSSPQTKKKTDDNLRVKRTSEANIASNNLLNFDQGNNQLNETGRNILSLEDENEADTNSNRVNNLDFLSSSFIPPNIQLSREVDTNLNNFNRRSSTINLSNNNINPNESNQDPNRFHANRPQLTDINPLIRYAHLMNRPESQANNPSNSSAHYAPSINTQTQNQNSSRMHNNLMRLWEDQQNRQELQRRQYLLNR